MNSQRGNAVRNDLLIHQRPRSIMQQHSAVAARPAPPSAAEPAAPLIPVRRASTPAPLPTATTATPQPSASALLLSLRDPASIRKAIILREVLGLPKALQPTLIGAGTLCAR